MLKRFAASVCANIVCKLTENPDMTLGRLIDPMYDSLAC